MSVWLIAIALTALTCALLYYAAARAPVNAGEARETGAVALYRAQLGEIERDLASGLLAPAEAEAARAELGRELLRQEREAPSRREAVTRSPLFALPLVALVALGTYWALGVPDLPDLPADSRPELANREELNEAISGVEARLREFPDDLQGWQVIAPVYLDLGRYADAVNAYRRILALGGETAAAKADLAAALIQANGGIANGEALALLQEAAADPDDRQAKYFLAVEAMREGRLEEARERWRTLIALGPADAPWMASAQQALAIIEAELGAAP